MRRTYWCAALVGAVVALAATLGCRTSTRSGLPEHIRTVEVHLFQNKTMYKSIEAYVTRRIIDRINADPTIRVVQNNGDAVISGEITRVTRRTLRETTTNEPETVEIVVHATYSFYDAVDRRWLAADLPLASNVTGMGPGLYERLERGANPEPTEISASNALADEIVRRAIGMW